MDKLNALSTLEGSYKKMNELNIDEKYPISEIKQIATKYGEKLVVELEDGSSMFLPKRCEQKASDYMKLNDEPKPLYFVYLGTKDVKKAQPGHMFKIVH